MEKEGAILARHPFRIVEDDPIWRGRRIATPLQRHHHPAIAEEKVIGVGNVRFEVGHWIS
jgi:hypothetical protein